MADANQVHRLRDMQVKEVSLVDRPANKRPFLLVKREDISMATGPEVHSASDGTFSTAQKAPAPPPAVPPAAGPDAPPAAPGDSAEAPAASGGKLALTADMKSAMAEVFVMLAKLVEDGAKLVDGAEDAADESEANPAPLADVLASICEASEDSAYALLGMPEEGMEGAGEPPHSEPSAAQAGPGTDGASAPVAARAPVLPFGKRLQLRKARRVISEASIVFKSAQLVEKVGRKMSKSRLERFKGALRMLADVFSELDESAAKAAPPPPAPPSKKKPGAPDEAAKVDSTIADLSKQLADARAQLAVVAKQAPSSNALSPEGDVRSAAAKNPDAWPMDMGNSRAPKFGED